VKLQDTDYQDFERIIFFLKKKGLIKNMKDLAHKIGYNYSYLSEVKNGKVEFSQQIKTALSKTFGIKFPNKETQNVDQNRYINTESNPVQTFNTKKNTFRSTSELIAMKVPIVPINAFAQYIDEFYQEAKDITFDYSWVEVDSYGKGNYLQFRIKGDSMNGGSINDTPDGAVVLAREIGQHLWSGGLYESQYGHILITNTNILFKDIIECNLEEGWIMCHSRNNSPEYKDFKLWLGQTKDDKPFVRQIFKVIKRNNM
jgi:hypothetical protein